MLESLQNLKYMHQLGSYVSSPSEGLPVTTVIGKRVGKTIFHDITIHLYYSSSCLQ